MQVKTAVVILNWNGLPMLQTYLPDVVRFSESEDTKVYVIDNCSSDGSLDYVRTSFPTVGIVRLERNYGFAGGYNRGLRMIEADYYVLLNSDVRVSEGWLAPVIDYMDNNDRVAACQPKVLSERDHTAFEYAGACGGYIDCYGYPFCRGRLFSTVEKDTGQYDSIVDVFWASGAAFFIRSAVYRQLGGFDESFFAHMEEIDLCWRIKRQGYVVSCIPESVVYHVGGATLSDENPRKLYLNFRNNLFMLRKNLSPDVYAKVMAIRLVLDWVSVMMFVLKLDFKKARAIVKARIDYARNKHEYVRPTASARFEECYGGSIVMKYYLCGCKTFDKIKAKWK